MSKIIVTKHSCSCGQHIIDTIPFSETAALEATFLIVTDWESIVKKYTKHYVCPKCKTDLYIVGVPIYGGVPVYG